MSNLLNLNEPIPEEFWVFVNLNNYVAEHNFKVSGQFFSGSFGSLGDAGFAEKFISGKVRYLPYAPCQNDLLALSPYLLSAINSYRVEYDAEVYREQFHPLYPSRFSAVYAFGDYATCEKVSQRYGWNLSTAKRFRLRPDPLNRVVKVNMDIVSLARGAYIGSSPQNTNTLWAAYWEGDGSISTTIPAPMFQRQTIVADTIWEYLIEGVIEHVDHVPLFTPAA